MSINPPIQVSTTDRFESEARQLGKRYRRIRRDIQPIIEQPESGEVTEFSAWTTSFSKFELQTVIFKKAKVVDTE